VTVQVNKKVALLLVLVLVSLMMIALVKCRAELQPLSNPKDASTYLWTFRTAGYTVSSPIIAGDLLYVHSGYPGSATAILYCVNASSGTQVWNRTSLFEPFTVANGYLFVAGSTYEGPFALDLHGVVACLNAETGDQVWNYSYGFFFDTPIVNGDIVYVSGFNVTSTGGNVGFVFALNASTGEKIWGYTGPEGTRLGNLVLVGSNLYTLSNSAVYKLSSLTGEEIWNYSKPGRFSSLAFLDQNVYVSSDFVNTTAFDNSGNIVGTVYQGGVLDLNASDGTKVWDYQINSSVEPLSVANDIIYAVSNDGNVYAFNALDGRRVWTNPTGLTTGYALLVNNSLYVSYSGGVICLDAGNGGVVWNFKAGDFADSYATNPTYDDGVVFVGWNGPTTFSPIIVHSFYAVNSFTGERLWSYPLDYSVNSAPLVVNGTAYIGGSFVTNESPDNLGPGAVIALKSNVNALPPEFPWLLVAVAAVVVAAVVAVSVVVYLKKRKR
jgi:outer membrane protein assembly factor BamB